MSSPDCGDGAKWPEVPEMRLWDFSARLWCFHNKILLFVSPRHIVFFTVHSVLFYPLSVCSDFSYKLCAPDKG